MILILRDEKTKIKPIKENKYRNRDFFNNKKLVIFRSTVT